MLLTDTSGFSDREFKLWDIETCECLAPSLDLDGYCHVQFSSDNKLLCRYERYDPALEVWDIESESLLKKFKTKQRGTKAVCCSSDSQFLVTTGKDKTIKIWKLKHGAAAKKS